MQVIDSRLHGGDERALFLAVAARLQAHRNQYSLNVDLIQAEHWPAARRMLIEQTETALSELASAGQGLASSEHSANWAATSSKAS